MCWVAQESLALGSLSVTRSGCTMPPSFRSSWFPGFAMHATETWQLSFCVPPAPVSVVMAILQDAEMGSLAPGQLLHQQGLLWYIGMAWSQHTMVLPVFPRQTTEENERIEGAARGRRTSTCSFRLSTEVAISHQHLRCQSYKSQQARSFRRLCCLFSKRIFR